MMNRQRASRALALTLVLTGGLAVAGTDAAHAQASCDAGTFTVDGVFDTDGYLACLSGTNSTPKSAKPGSAVVVTLTGFTPGETVEIIIDGLTEADLVVNAGNGTAAKPIIAKADASGTVRVSMKMPTKVGTYTIKATGTTSKKSVSTQIVISATGTGNTSLPQTGSDALRLTAVGLGLVVLGGGTVVGARRRRQLVSS